MTTSNYPDEFDTLPDVPPDAEQHAPSHRAQHNNANAAIRAIQQTLGVNPQGDEEDVASRIEAHEQHFNYNPSDGSLTIGAGAGDPNDGGAPAPTAGPVGIAIGPGADADSQGIALGPVSKAFPTSLALGGGSVATAYWEASFGAFDEPSNIHVTRTLSNITDGTESHHAATVGQLHILESPNGTRYRLTVADDGTLNTEPA